MLLTSVVLLMTACAGAPRAVPGPSIPADIEASGRSIPYQGLQRWSVASVPSRDSIRLTVFATGSDTGGGPCGPPVLRLHAEESASSVVLSVAEYQQAPEPGTGCPAIGYLAGPQRIDLRRAMGDRTLIDASDGKQHAPLIGSDYPQLTAPEGFSPSPIGRYDGTQTIRTTWSDDDGAGLALEVAGPASTRDIAPYGETIAQPEIHGTTATLYRSGTGEYGRMTLQWTPNPTQTITLAFDNSAGTGWTPAEAIAIARSVTNYRMQRTGRLPQPTSPGTAAASYNSADGPVVHAPNMFKSSGVYIALDCQGSGRVTVSMRGTDFRFDCTAALSHQVMKSTGTPNDPFYVDVSATKGVRWSLTLARASLDGS